MTRTDALSYHEIISTDNHSALDALHLPETTGKANCG